MPTTKEQMPRLPDRLPRGFVKADYAEWLGAIFSRFLVNSARKPTLSKPVRRSSALGINRGGWARSIGSRYGD